MKSKIVGGDGVVAATRKRGPYNLRSWQPVILSVVLSMPMSGCMTFCMGDEYFSTMADAREREHHEWEWSAKYLSYQDCQTALGQTPFQVGQTPDKNINYTLSALNQFFWAQHTPREIFLEFVLQPSFLDEDSRPWRAEMHKRFAPVAKDCKTRREAILAIAKNAATVCGVKYDTTRRAPNQCVAESLESGKASCTGLSILLAAAYRSVGIPARIAGVGEWGDRPGNHTWVEVWDDDGWHAVEYYPDEKGLDRGWIYEPIAKLDPENPRSRVFAVDPTGTKTFFLPWAPENAALKAVDRTAAYQAVGRTLGLGVKAAEAADKGVVVFEARDASGKRVALDFRVLDGDTEVFAGHTPGPLDDLNNAPRKALKLNHGYTVEYPGKAGVKRTVPLTVKAGETVKLVLTAE